MTGESTIFIGYVCSFRTKKHILALGYHCRFSAIFVLYVVINKESLLPLVFTSMHLSGRDYAEKTT